MLNADLGSTTRSGSGPWPPRSQDDVGLVCVYHRYRYDGTLTQALVVPLMRSLFGRQLVHPLAEEFACLRAGPDAFLAQPVWETDLGRHGLEFWLPGAAIERGFTVGQAVLGRERWRPPSRRTARPHGGPGGRCPLCPGRAGRRATGSTSGDRSRRRPSAWPPRPLPGGPAVDAERMQVGFVQGVRDLRRCGSASLAPENLGEVLELSDRPLERFRFLGPPLDPRGVRLPPRYRTPRRLPEPRRPVARPLSLGRAASVILETSARPPAALLQSATAWRHVRGGQSPIWWTGGDDQDPPPDRDRARAPRVDDGRYPGEAGRGRRADDHRRHLQEDTTSSPRRSASARGRDRTGGETPLSPVDNDGWAGSFPASGQYGAIAIRWRPGPSAARRLAVEQLRELTVRPDRTGQLSTRMLSTGARGVRSRRASTVYDSAYWPGAERAGPAVVVHGRERRLLASGGLAHRAEADRRGERSCPSLKMSAVIVSASPTTRFTGIAAVVHRGRTCSITIGRRILVIATGPPDRACPPRTCRPGRVALWEQRGGRPRAGLEDHGGGAAQVERGERLGGVAPVDDAVR